MNDFKIIKAHLIEVRFWYLFLVLVGIALFFVPKEECVAGYAISFFLSTVFKWMDLITTQRAIAIGNSADSYEESDKPKINRKFFLWGSYLKSLGTIVLGVVGFMITITGIVWVLVSLYFAVGNQLDLW